MRYSGGVYDIRKKCYSSFSGDTCPNSIVYNNVWTPILASSGQNELGKKTFIAGQLLFSDTFRSPDKGCVVLLLPEVHNSEHAFVREQNFEPLVGGPVPVSPTKQQPILDHFLCQNRFLGSTTTDQL